MAETQAQQVVEVGYGGNERLMMNMGPQHPSSHGVFRDDPDARGRNGRRRRRRHRLPPSLPREAGRDAHVRPVPVHRVEDRLRRGHDVGAGVRLRRGEDREIRGASARAVSARDRRPSCSGSPRTASGSARGAWTWAAPSAAAPRCSSTASASARWSSTVFEELTGARLLYGFHQIGGTRYDLPPGWDKKRARRRSTSSRRGSTSTRPCWRKTPSSACARRASA